MYSIILILLVQVSKRLRWQGNDITENHSAVATWRQEELVMEMIVTHTPRPEIITNTLSTLDGVLGPIQSF